MPKTTLIGVTQVEGKPTIVQVDVLENGALNPRLGYEKPMTAAQVITLVCQIYDIAPSYQLDIPKQVLACEHCHKEYEAMPRMGICTLCMGNVK